MRISDWSSDVCSSDLAWRTSARRQRDRQDGRRRLRALRRPSCRGGDGAGRPRPDDRALRLGCPHGAARRAPGIARMTRWQRHLAALGLLWAIILALFWRDAADMAGIWWHSSTFTHCLLMVPMIGWLVSQRAALLRPLTPVFWWPALIWIAGAGDRKSTRLNSSHYCATRMPSSA